eukprot:352239-Chlamydomonas_euryale.AAC.1
MRRFKNTDKLPVFVDRAFSAPNRSPADLAARSASAQVEGTHRFKHVQQPVLAAGPAGAVLRLAAVPPPPPVPALVPEPRTKTLGTQSDYRENEAQTTPWDPPAAAPAAAPAAKQAALSAKHHAGAGRPEVLHLADLHFGDGLPPGVAEVLRVERRREKRMFEATLPPLDDLQALPLRQRMIEEWEAKEWAARDEEVRRASQTAMGKGGGRWVGRRRRRCHSSGAEARVLTGQNGRFQLEARRAWGGLSA